MLTFMRCLRHGVSLQQLDINNDYVQIPPLTRNDSQSIKAAHQDELPKTANIAER